MENGVDDLPEIRLRFTAWIADGRKEDYEWVLTWVYAWTRRYFLRKFVEGQIRTSSEAEKLMEEVFFQAHEKHGSVREPDRFPSWISVICKYRFLNYIRSSNHHEAADEIVADTLASGEDIEQDVLKDIDIHTVFEKILASRLDELPDYIRNVIHKKIWEDKSYEEIGRELNYPVETVRAYFARGLKILRETPGVMSLREFR